MTDAVERENKRRARYAEIAQYEYEINLKAQRLLAEDPSFCLSDEPIDDQDEIRAEATHITLNFLAQQRWCEEEGCEHL